MRMRGLGLAVLPLVLVGCSDSAPEPAADPTSTPSATPSSPASPKPAQDPTVIDDANRLAPALESYSRSAGYAMSLGEAVAKLNQADLFPTEPNVVGSYVYDDAAVEFRLCIESPQGAWATYDTSPMSIFETGDTDGCPR